MGKVTEKQLQHTGKSERQSSSEYSKEALSEQHEHMREQLEKAEQAHKERQSTSEALHEAKRIASEHNARETAKIPSPAERRRGPISKKQLEGSFEAQMSQVQSHMSSSARAFSKFIHNKPIEKTSEFVGSTIARPNALLSGSIFAFVSITILYFAAKHYGYALTGFETIAAFATGWLIGITYDYITGLIRRKD